jgi:hypothetical protein
MCIFIALFTAGRFNFALKCIFKYWSIMFFLFVYAPDYDRCCFVKAPKEGN